MAERRTTTIKTDYLARVEGEGAMLVEIDGGEVDDVKLNIYEPPRFFEAFLRGRAFTEAPDITARICGICPVAYQMSSVQAMEQTCGVEVGGQLRALRRLLYCGEWIESHALHVYMLHAPDFLGYESAIELARDHPELVAQALELKKTGNEVMTRRRRARGAPDQRPRRRLVPGAAQARARAARREARAGAGDRARDRDASPPASTSRTTSRTTSSSRSTEPGEYPIDRGRIVSSRGLDIAVAEYDEHFVEEHVEWSNALHSRCASAARTSAARSPASRSPPTGSRRSRARRRTEAGLERGRAQPVPQHRRPRGRARLRGRRGAAADRRVRGARRAGRRVRAARRRRLRRTEAPRGLLYHRYELDDDGTILDAKIVPPTSQNQRTIEEDLRGVVERSLDLPDDELGLLCEQTIRNYDPCISCATHFLDARGPSGAEGRRDRQRLARRRRGRARRRAAAARDAARRRRGARARGRAVRR